MESAKIDVQEASQRLSQALNHGDLSAALAALEQGAIPGGEDCPAPLSAASQWRPLSAKLFEALLAAGADPHEARPGFGRYWPVGYDVMRIDDPEAARCARALREAGARMKEDPNYLILAAGSPRVEALRDLLEEGVSVETKDKEEFTALLSAALFGRAVCVKELLGRGADKEARSRQGQSAIELAIQMGCEGFEEVVEILMEAGAEIKKAMEINQKELEQSESEEERTRRERLAARLEKELLRREAPSEERWGAPKAARL